VSRAYIPTALRKAVARAARHRCGYCLTQELVVGAAMEIEHIISEALGGRTEEENLWQACSLCNQHKGSRVAGRDPVTGEGVPLFNPRRQVWAEHFVWTTDGTRIIGLTPIGRATVIGLNLNRPALVRPRRVWVRAGWHPPKDVSPLSG
jgi:hypothetical protein